MSDKLIASVFPFHSHPKSRALFHLEFELDTPEHIIKEAVENKMYIKYGEDYPYILKTSTVGNESDYYDDCAVCGGYCLDSNDM